MAVKAGDTELYRRDVKARGQELSAAERERLLEQYLPTPPRAMSPAPLDGKAKSKRKTRRRRVRPFVKNKLHALIFFLIHLFFGIYLRIRQVYHAVVDRVLAILYYHHRTPELIRKDVKGLSRLPEHLSVILTLRVDEDGGLETLMDEVAELSAWCSSIGIPLLSVYEKSGILKSYMPSLQVLIDQKLATYFGPYPATPSLRVFAPNHTSISRSPSPNPSLRLQTNGSTNGHDTNGHDTNGHDTNGHRTDRPYVNILLLSSSDGRATLVDLTRTLTEMSQSSKLDPKDITAELIDAEIAATTAIPTSDSPAIEPDLLIIFGPSVKLQGYPPWQVRLTEIFCVGDSSADVSHSGYGKVRETGSLGEATGARVEYQAFLRGLWRFAGADMRFGR